MVGRLRRVWPTIYSVVVRAVPVVVIIFVLFFVIAEFVNLPPFWAGSLALGFASGAYQSEIFRGAIQSVAPGQMTAARAIGMSRTQAVRHIILPQAIRLALPGWGNEATLVLKDSTLVFRGGRAGDFAARAICQRTHAGAICCVQRSRCCSTWR
jgi:polar amino acid transport system permease protein